jgi:hypothetical protein
VPLTTPPAETCSSPPALTTVPTASPPERTVNAPVALTTKPELVAPDETVDTDITFSDHYDARKRLLSPRLIIG